jgi:hypothetical protein
MTTETLAIIGTIVVGLVVCGIMLAWIRKHDSPNDGISKGRKG